MKEHMMEHRLFECKLCYNKFRLNKYLMKHQKKIHKDELHLLDANLGEDQLQFKCSTKDCNKKLANARILEFHKKKNGYIYSYLNQHITTDR